MPRSRSRACLVALTFTVVASLSVATSQAAAGPVATPAAAVHTADPRGGDSGRAALTRVAHRLPDVAARNGMSRDRLLRILTSDTTAHLDRADRLFYVDPTPTPEQIQADSSRLAEVQRRAGQKPTGRATGQFALHSRPGSSRVIHLDFDGGTVSGTAWNVATGVPSVVVAPYDTDGSPTTWSAGEDAVVESVFRQVAEDFAPFDVDVTTAAPGADALVRSSSADPTYGVTVMVSNETFYYSGCGCGGAAYVGAFDQLGGSGQAQRLAWVFTRGVGKGAKHIAEAAAHEAGHTVGLWHDGAVVNGRTYPYYAGQGPWAPIMGVGYGKPVTQFSNGDYAGANEHQDDFSVMAATGLARLADDYGNSMASANPLAVRATASGVIATAADADYFTVGLSAGRAVVTVRAAGTSPDLDASASLYDSTGTLVGTANPPVGMVTSSLASGMSATLTTATLPAGTYYVKVDGAGFGSALVSGYGDYGSVGHYTLTVTR